MLNLGKTKKFKYIEHGGEGTNEYIILKIVKQSIMDISELK